MIDFVTPKEAKREAAKGLKEAIAVSIKKFECFLPLTCKDLTASFLEASDDTCGLCQYYDMKYDGTIFEADDDDFEVQSSEQKCPPCVLCLKDKSCYVNSSQFHRFNKANLATFEGTETTITQFRKETRKMIKILKKLYKECK